MATDKKASTYRLSDEGKRLLQELAQALQVSETAVLEIAIRKVALDNGLWSWVPTTDPS